MKTLLGFGGGRPAWITLNIAWVHRALVVCLFGLPAFTVAQGTLRFTFEEVPNGERPPYVSLPFLALLGVEANVYVSTPRVAAYEGQKFLGVSGGAILTPPNGELITGFSAHLYIPTIPGDLIFAVGGLPVDTATINQWQTISGSFQTPTKNLLMTGEYRIGERFAAPFYLDDIQLFTVPEPQAAVIFLCGALALLGFKYVAVRSW